MTTEERREYMRKWYQEHKEQLKEYNRNWREKNAERDKEQKLQYYKKHRQECKEYNLKWRAEHPEHVKQQRQCIHDRYHNDPAYRGYRLFSRYKRSDIEKNLAPADLSEYPTLEEVNEMLLQPCVWCGQSDWHKIGLDRKDNRFGHIRGNLQPCCKRCNDKKRELSNEEFRQAIAEGRIKLKTVKAVKTDADIAAIPAMPSMRSLLA